mmetsp:Transcript_5985/g.9191  ORF Transcript_5985/g.9191 Transcript_5985/m.9191 type:complete len:698 (+) Transcript_5985:151-2244(+)
MFYSQFILTKKGPLGKIWIAAHLDKKLTKVQIFSTDIDSAVHAILFPTVPISLRLSGHLLLGVVRIYSRKVRYLLSDSSEAMVKIKQAFRPGVVDLPAEATTVSFGQVTLPETLDDHDFLVPELNVDFIPFGEQHVSRPELITMKETRPSMLDMRQEAEERFEIPDQEDWLNERPVPEVESPEVPRRAEPGLAASAAAKVTIESPERMRAAPADVAPDFEPMELDLGMLPREEEEAARKESPLHQERVSLAPDLELEAPPRESVSGLEQQQQQPQTPLVPFSPAAMPDVTPINTTPLVFEPMPTPTVVAKSQKRVAKRRKVAMDERCELTGEEIKSALNNTSDIVRDRRRQREEVEEGTDGEEDEAREPADIDKMLGHPFLLGTAAELVELFSRGLKKQLESAKATKAATPAAKRRGRAHGQGAGEETPVPHTPAPAHTPRSSPPPKPLEPVAEVAEGGEEEGMRIPTMPHFGAEEEAAPAAPVDMMEMEEDHMQRLEEGAAVGAIALVQGEEEQQQQQQEREGAPVGEVPAPESPVGAAPPTPARPVSPQGPNEEVKALPPPSRRSRISAAAAAELESELETETAPTQSNDEPPKHSFSTRTVRMVGVLQRAFRDQESSASSPEDGQLVYNEMVEGKKRKTAAGCFFELLVLSTRGFIKVQQAEPYGSITIRPTDKLFEPTPSVTQHSASTLALSS